ncbi:MAG: M20/M25/M40 family metallo-hydrolase, partial [Amphiplicatus sp.]
EFDAYAREVEAEMQAKWPACRVETVQITNAPPLSPQADNPAADLAKALTGQNSTGVVSYAAEAGQFQEAGFSTVVCGPGSIEQAHQPNEFISVAQVGECGAFLRKLIARMAV